MTPASRDLAALGPTERTELIYRAARAGLDQQLWQAALGRFEAPEAAPVASLPAAARPLSVAALVEALAVEERIAPSLTATPPVADAPTGGGALQLGVNAPYRPMIEQAGARTGLDPALLAAIVDAEAGRTRDGRWNPASRNPRSSATGLGQFLDSTWLGEARRAGSWLRSEASARGWLAADGSVRAAARERLLALRADPEASIQAIADHAAGNLRQLRAAGVKPGDLPGEARAVYLAHHLGIGDALRFLGSGLREARAGRLLAAQVGTGAASRRIAEAGSASDAHRAWLLAYVDRRIRPSRFLSA